MATNAVFRNKVEVPKLGVCFKVEPVNISRELFQQERDNPEEEKVRNWINEAFFELDKNPGKYERNFYILIPERKWGHKTVPEVLGYATAMGGEVSDWIEKGIEFAQQIVNGEKWSEICRKPDPIKQARVIIWKNGLPRFVGGPNASAVDVCDVDLTNNHTLYDTVPEITIR